MRSRIISSNLIWVDPTFDSKMNVLQFGTAFVQVDFLALKHIMTAFHRHVVFHGFGGLKVRFHFTTRHLANPWIFSASKLRKKC